MDHPRAVPLQPTLWRTCRVLANRHRLRILQAVIRHPGQTVSQVAQTLNLRLPMASSYLRALNARGLLQAVRSGRYVYYSPSPDPSVTGTTPLLEALKRTLASERHGIPRAFRQLTAFTHPRRLVILKVLSVSAQGSTLQQLRTATGISRAALVRHLAKLGRRGLVDQSFGRYRCVHPKTCLARTLMTLGVGRGRTPPAPTVSPARSAGRRADPQAFSKAVLQPR